MGENPTRYVVYCSKSLQFTVSVIFSFSFCRAAEYLVRTGPIVTLEVAKQGAIYHGLATLLSQPSPVMTRGAYVFVRPFQLVTTTPRIFMNIVDVICSI